MPRARSGPTVKSAMLVTPIEYVVTEDVGAHTQRLHAPILGTCRQLTMSNRVAMIPSRIPLEHCFNGADKGLGGLVAIAVQCTVRPAR